jgi:DNA repair exonuclease SbcCD ATPase subunit
MSRKKVTSVDSSGNGSETTGAASSSVEASGDELDRLRDILIGNHVRSSEESIGEVQAQLMALREEFEARLNDLGANLANDLQQAQESARQRDEEVDGDLRQLRQLLDAEKDIRSSVGQMLVELGQRLQDVIPDPDEA